MKKIIAILSVFAIMACAFAADPTADSLKITAKVPSTEPVFKLETTSGVGTNGSITYSQYVAGTTATQPTATNGTAGDISTDLLTADAAVAFKISQTNVARSQLKYTLTVTATDLVLTDYATKGTASTIDANEKFTVASTTPAVDENSTSGLRTGTSADKVVVTTSANAFTAVYSGKVAGTDGKGYTVGTFTVTWGQNAEAVVGNYEAWVTLGIVAE